MAELQLRSVRYQRGDTQPELASAIGCTQQAVQLWEGGRARPRPHYARKLSDHFARPIAELLSETETSTPKGAPARSFLSSEST
jgi:transcriptional regulator with XRE-family HTH domain